MPALIATAVMPLFMGAAHPAVATASADPTVSALGFAEPQLPAIVTSESDRSIDVIVAPYGTKDLTVRFSAPGLSFDPAEFDLGEVSSGQVVSTKVNATAGGLHPVTVEVTSSDSPTVTATYPYLWTPGGDPLPATGDLTGVTYADTDIYTAGDDEYADRQMLTFLDDTTAYIGLWGGGRPTCGLGSTTRDRGCVRYYYDIATGLVQLGGRIGRVVSYGLYTNGIGPIDQSGGGEEYSSRTWTERLTYPAAGTRLDGTWRMKLYNGWGVESIDRALLVLRRDGTFNLRYSYYDYLEGDQVTRRTGTYRFTGPGRLQFKGKFGTEVHTLALHVDKDGKADRSRLWFTFGHRYVVGGPMKAVTS